MKKYISLLLVLFVLFSGLAFGGSSANNPANNGNLGGFQATDDALYTPTVTGLGTLASSGLYWHREGQYMIITGKVTPGTPTAAALSISLPAGNSINTTVAAANSVNLGYAHGFIGNYFTSLGFTVFAFYDGSDATKVYFSYTSSAGAMTKANGNDLTSAGNAVTFNLRLPISGWSAGGGNASLAKICSGLIVDSGTAAISRSTENCAASVADVGTGQYTVTFTTGYFSTTPNCTCSAYDSSQTICTVDSSTAISPTTARFKVADNSTTPVNASTMFICTQ